MLKAQINQIIQQDGTNKITGTVTAPKHQMSFTRTIPIKRLMRAAAVILVSLTTMSAFASDCKNKLETFLNSPSKFNYLQIMSSAAPGALSVCWDVLEANNDDLDKITRLVVAGNQWAIRFVAIGLKALDGGYLEDALKILGQAAHSDPALLLSLDVDGTISEHELGDAATMLPETFVDNRNASLNELRKRVHSFESVHKESLSQPRSYVLKELSSEIHEVESTPKNWK